MTSEAQRKAAKKYLDTLETLRFRVPLGQGCKIKTHAESKGLSLNAYINKLIEQDMSQTTDNSKTDATSPGTGE